MTSHVVRIDATYALLDRRLRRARRRMEKAERALIASAFDSPERHELAKAYHREWGALHELCLADAAIRRVLG